MGIWYRRVLTLETFRNVSMGSKLLARTPVSSSPIPGKVPHFSNEWNLGFCGSSSISSRLFHLGSSGGGRRSYKFPNFKPKLGYKKWYEKPRNIWLALCLGSGITVYMSNLETIPYTNRTHLVRISIETEKRVGKTLFKDLIKQKRLEGKILAADHPESVRANSIAKNMIEALENGLLILQSDQDLGSHDQFTMETGQIKMSWKKGKAKPETRHLMRSLKWEVVVVDAPRGAVSYPHGKIIVPTGLLRHFETDAEIATLIGHQIGHIVARHLAEWVTKNLWRIKLARILCCFASRDVVINMALVKPGPFSAVMEADAVYIGLMLMASAGYDPRTAISTYEKLTDLSHNREERLCNMRAKLDHQGQAMKRAMNLYRP